MALTMPSLKTLRRVGLVGATVSAGALAAWLIERGWERHTDTIGPDGLVLPDGKQRTIRTDDGAELAVTITAPRRRRSWPLGSHPRTVVLVHGWTNSRSVWAPVARRLVESGHRVVMYDQRGHGASTPGEDPPIPARLGDDLAAVLDQLDLRDAVLTGHSMGGFTVMAFACDHPDVLAERVRGLALVSTAAHGLGAGPLDLVMTRIFGSDVVTWAMSRPRLGLFLTRGTVGRQAAYAELDATRDMFVATDPAVRAACYAAFSGMDLREGLSKVETPTVVVVGSRDVLTPPRLGRAIAATVPGARFELVAGAGHMLPFESPDRVATAIAELDGVASSV